MKEPMTPGYITLPHAFVTGLLAFLGWVGKYLFGVVREEWRGVKSTISTIEATTRIQAENHLHTIQENGAKTNELLGKMVENQVELNGWLKGRASRG